MIFFLFISLCRPLTVTLPLSLDILSLHFSPPLLLCPLSALSPRATGLAAGEQAQDLEPPLCRTLLRFLISAKNRNHVEKARIVSLAVQEGRVECMGASIEGLRVQQVLPVTHLWLP
jgi:hypothetical protein